MEDLIKQIQDRTGLPADKVIEVVTIVTEFLKDNLPQDLIDQITAYMSQAAMTAGGSASSAGGAAASGATGVVSGAVGVASSALSKMLSILSEVLPGGEDPEDTPSKSSSE
ncbi:MAG: hypothetical protein M5U23_07745 [Acidimicrobiia bacterium]|nr:hypothetical protein [Acidimicrobiia bacterium]